MVNQLKANIKQFIESGAILGDGCGKYWVGSGLIPVNDHKKYPLFWSQNFFDSPQAFFAENFVELTKEKLFIALDELGEPSRPELHFSGGEELFKEFFEESKKHIHQGHLKKVVPYCCFKSKFEMTDLSKIYFLKNLLLHSEKTQSYLYGLWQKGIGFMGSTPEVLFNKTKGAIKTMALAGTRAAQAHDSDLLKDAKEISEHDFVVQDIINKLKSHGEVFAEPIEVKKFSRLAHLLTKINLKGSQLDYVQLVKLLHPTAALGGHPSPVALEVLRGFDQRLGRANFGAPLGCEFDSDHALSVVMIRGMTWKLNSVHVGVGCGVVNESVYEKEWAEVKLKFNSILSALGLYEQP